MIRTAIDLILLGLGLALVAILLWRYSRRQRENLGLPAGRVISIDTGGWQRCAQPLYSARYRLAGKPDYLVQTSRGLVPVEVKPGRSASQPYASDILQLGAYLLLVREETGKRPAYGLLCYGQHKFEIPYTTSLEKSVITCLEQMKRLHDARQVRPQHDEPQRCLRCGHRDQCDVRLA